MKRKINVIGNLNLDLLHPSIEIIAVDYIGWAKNQNCSKNSDCNKETNNIQFKTIKKNKY